MIFGLKYYWFLIFVFQKNLSPYANYDPHETLNYCLK